MHQIVEGRSIPAHIFIHRCSPEVEVGERCRVSSFIIWDNCWVNELTYKKMLPILIQCRGMDGFNLHLDSK